jgi:hypothetical protein
VIKLSQRNRAFAL